MAEDNKNEKAKEINKEKGATLLVSVLILALLTVFVAAALTNTTSNTVVTFNDSSSSQAFYAAYSGLEKMSKEFSDLFNINTNPSKAQLDGIKNAPPAYITDIALVQNIRFLKNIDPNGIELETGPFAGLKVLRDEYELTSTATTKSGVQVQLTRSFYNNLIPIFQFGIFGTRDLEFYNGPPFNFGGRVHSNGDLYLTPAGELLFTSTVTTVGEVVRDVLRNGFDTSGNRNTAKTIIKAPNGSNQFLQNRSNGNAISSGSVIKGPDLPNKPKPDSPKGDSKNSAFQAIIAPMGGRLVANAPALRLPFENGGNRPIELIRRTIDPNEQTAKPNLFYSRYSNKPGLRITLADSESALPGGEGGIQLDAPPNKTGAMDQRLGYIPGKLGVSRASRINGHRVKGWLKIETVDLDAAGNVVTSDVTEPISRLGLTIHDPASGQDDSRAVFRLQRYSLPSASNIRVANADVKYDYPAPSTVKIRKANRQLSLEGTAPNTRLYLRKSAPPPSDNRDTSFFEVDDRVAQQPASCNISSTLDTPGTSPVVLPCGDPIPNNTPIPFPISLYDPREGRVLDTTGNNLEIEPRGLFSFVDIDMQNLKRLLSGAYDQFFQNENLSFRANKIPSPNNGWILYISDRRSDTAGGGPNGRYDMELTYGDNDYVPPLGQTLFKMQDTNDNGQMEADIGFPGESAPAKQTIDILDALTKGSYKVQSGGKRIDLTQSLSPLYPLFRRAVRLVNGENLAIDGSGSLIKELGLNQTRGITVATENPAYVQGNYNTSLPTNFGSPTPPANYMGPQVPCSVVADAVTLLSNSWSDSKSFLSPYDLNGRRATTTAYRFAVLTGRPRSGLYLKANDNQRWGVKGQPGTDEPDDTRLYGGVHNFLRYIENWGGQRLAYTGALIDGWDSWQANGTFKCCNIVYSPPTRDYTFNTAYLDPKQLPPGTPNLQYLLLTSFRQNLNPSVEKK